METIAGSIYVYTPGFIKRHGTRKLLELLILGEFPDYKVILENGSVHMVHKKYKQYIIKVNSGYNNYYEAKIFYNKSEANEYLNLCKRQYLKSLIEYAIIDWNKKVLKYGWYKHYTYTNICTTLQNNYDDCEYEHPLEEYLYNDFLANKRIDDENNIIWEINADKKEENIDKTNDNNLTLISLI
jgi:hypothetical protein